MSRDETCKNCKHMHQFDNEDGKTITIECRRYPEAIRTYYNHWCGEFKRKGF